MDFGAIETGVNLASGIAGMLGIGGKTKKKSRLEQLAEKSARGNLRNQELALSVAEKYDPATEDKLAFDEANRMAAESAKQGLDQINTDFKNAGGAPTGDTAFQFDTRDLMRRTFDPVRAMMYEQSATRSARKMNMLNAASGAGGNTFSEFMNLANSQNTDPTGALVSLQAGLRGISGMTQKKKKGGEWHDGNEGSDATN